MFMENTLLILCHSTLIRNLIKLKGTAKLTVQGERVCLKDSKYILFEILENQTWKGCTYKLLPIWQFGWLGRQVLVLPFHVPCARISNKIYLECQRHTLSPCAVSFAVPFNFIRFLISALCPGFKLLLRQRRINQRNCLKFTF